MPSITRGCRSTTGCWFPCGTVRGNGSRRSLTFSKTIDQGTGYFNQFDQGAQRGPSQLDQTHRFVATGVWSPEFRALRNFDFSTVLNLASGRPYTAVFDQPELNFSIVPGEGFNSFRGPTVKNVDFSVSRTFHLGERYELGFRAEAFDLFNPPTTSRTWSITFSTWQPRRPTAQPGRMGCGPPPPTRTSKPRARLFHDLEPVVFSSRPT
jgi:hypothetical protein